MKGNGNPIAMDAGVDQVTLTFREQSDGRRVARLPSGKVVLVHYDAITKIKDGETWLVKLEHRELFAVAHPLDRIGTATTVNLGVVAPVKQQLNRTSTTVVRAGEPVVSIKPAATNGSTKEAPVNRAMPEMFLKPSDRVAIFVDGANMDGACRDAGYYLDYFKVGAFLRGKASFRQAFYYIADFTAQDPLQIRFLDFLAHSGYIVRKKPVKVLVDKETGAKTYKANVDTEMVLDMVNTCDNYDVAFLLSGDSDFERCVDLLRSRGKRVYVMTAEKTISRELSHVADKPIFFIEDYEDILRRDDRVPPT
jgi:uncharacterized LabA/DUF88 family protein